MTKAIRACEALNKPNAAHFLRFARTVERFCAPLALSFWPSTSGVGPMITSMPAKEFMLGGYAVAIASGRCALKAHAATSGAATGLTLYDRRHALQSACAEVRVLTRDYDLDWLARRVGEGLMGRQL